MKVYQLYLNTWDGDITYGIYSNLEKSEEAKKKFIIRDNPTEDNFFIDEFELDKDHR